ncbi:hypothetical protein LEP1GSC193_2860, partial [Leptospira alstonii serovar Pingchang str. 80-412]
MDHSAERIDFRQNGAPSGLENRGLDAKHLPQNKKTNRRNVMKRKVYVGMDVHKETISIAYLTSNSKELVKEQ